ncbi:MAG: cupin domain-containing protein [Anaerolineae bacterium]|nr:cupin domain-containing protein [Anaerolineae bacterium]
MTVVKFSEAEKTAIAEGRLRYLAHTNDLMVVVIDFTDGPQTEPDPPHSHPHEQITYVAEGELLFFIDGEPQKLSTGDLITVDGDVPHTIQLLSDKVRLVDTFNPIREEFLK